MVNCCAGAVGSIVGQIAKIKVPAVMHYVTNLIQFLLKDEVNR